MEMRQALCECLDEMMAENENIVVIDADLAKPNGTFPLRKKYPERAIDVGIAEQNMASVAAAVTVLFRLLLPLLRLLPAEFATKLQFPLPMQSKT